MAFDASLGDEYLQSDDFFKSIWITLYIVQKVVLIQKILRGRGGAIALKRMRRQADDFVIRQEEMRV